MGREEQEAPLCTAHSEHRTIPHSIGAPLRAARPSPGAEAQPGDGSLQYKQGC